jgi:hypothetical protein
MIQGTGERHPPASIRLDLPDGRTVIAESSGALFVIAARAIAARWPQFGL